MLNLEKESFIGNIVLKRSFQMALMSVKISLIISWQDKIYFCFINSISILVVLTYCYHCLYPYSYSYYYHYCIQYFSIIIPLFYCYYSHHYYCSQYYQCYLFGFISFYFLLSLLSVLRVPCMCRLVISYFFFFLVNDLYFILALLIHVKNHFSRIIIIITIIFFQHYQSQGENSGNEFEWHGLPLPIDYFG